MDISKTIIAPLEFKGESLVVHSEEMHQSGIQVVDMHGVLSYIVAVIIGRTMDMTAPHTRPCQHLSKAAGMVVTASSVTGFLRVGGSAKLSPPSHNRIL